MSNKGSDKAGGQGKPARPEDTQGKEKAPAKEAEAKTFCKHGNIVGACLRCK